jgi:hypothetical protein
MVLDLVIGSADQNEMKIVHFDIQLKAASAQSLIPDKKLLNISIRG